MFITLDDGCTRKLTLFSCMNLDQESNMMRVRSDDLPSEHRFRDMLWIRCGC